MASVHRALPKNGGKRFRDGCALHWQVRPNPSEAARGVAKETVCKRAQADAIAARVKTELNSGTHVDMRQHDKITVAEWAQEYTAAARQRKVSLSTQRRYESMCRKHIVPHLGHRTMVSVRRAEVDEWAAGRMQAGLKESSMATVGVVLRHMFNLWMEREHPLPRGNPVRGRLVTVPPKDFGHGLSVAEVGRWRDAAPDDVRAMVDLEAYTGSRESEIRGLKAGDITWRGVKDTAEPLGPFLTRLAELPDDEFDEWDVEVTFRRRVDRLGEEGPTKNARANRTLPLSQEMTGRLGAHLTRWPPAHGWLFTNMRAVIVGRPWTPTTYLKHLQAAADAAGVRLPPNQISHAFRHHCVSVLRDRGLNDHQIAEWVGDTALTITTTYGQPMADSKRRTMAVIKETRAAARPRLRVVG
jgi:integrase